MKKWIESWLIPLINKVADTNKKKRAAYVFLALLGIVVAWFGVSLTQVSVDQLIILGQTRLGGGRLK